MGSTPLRHHGRRASECGNGHADHSLLIGLSLPGMELLRRKYRIEQIPRRKRLLYISDRWAYQSSRITRWFTAHGRVARSR